MENNSKEKKPTEGRRFDMKKAANRYGVPVALFACAAIVAGTWFFTDGDLFQKTETTPTPQASTDAQSGADLSENLNDVLKSAAPTATTTVTPSATATGTQSSLPDLIKPVKGDIVKPFAYDTLVYMKTLNQWSTHPGVDIAAELGTDVVAALPGEVLESTKDSMLGNCVKIQSANDIVCLYAGLMSIEDIEKGDQVEAGELIGQVGNTAASEIAEDPHLHFEVTQNGTPVNPENSFKE